MRILTPGGTDAAECRFFTPARRRPAAVQWRRYGTQVSPHEAMRRPGPRTYGAGSKSESNPIQVQSNPNPRAQPPSPPSPAARVGGWWC